MLNYSCLEKTLPAPLSCDASSKSQLSSSSADGFQCVLDPSSGQGDALKAFPETLGCRSVHPVVRGAQNLGFHHQHTMWPQESPPLGPSRSAPTGLPMPSAVVGQQQPRWCPMGECQRSMPPPPPLPVPTAPSLLDAAPDNRLPNPMQQRIELLHQPMPFNAMHPQSSTGMVTQFMQPTMSDGISNGPCPQWQSGPFLYDCPSRFVPAPLPSAPYTNEKAYHYPHPQQQQIVNDRLWEHNLHQQQRQQPNRHHLHAQFHHHHHHHHYYYHYQQQQQGYHCSHHNVYHPHAVSRVVNPSPPMFLYREGGRSDGPGAVLVEGGACGGNDGPSQPRVESGKYGSSDCNDSESRRKDASSRAQRGRHNSGVPQDDNSDALDQSAEMDKSTVDSRGSFRCVGSGEFEHSYVSNSRSRGSNKSRSGKSTTAPASCSTGGDSNQIHAPQQGGSTISVNQDTHRQRCGGQVTVGGSDKEEEYDLSTGFRNAGKSSGLPNNRAELAPHCHEGTDEQEPGGSATAKTKSFPTNPCISCSMELKPASLAMLRDDSHVNETLSNQGLSPRDPPNLSSHTPPKASLAAGVSGVEILGGNYLNVLPHQSSTQCQVMQCDPTQLGDVQQGRASASAGLAHLSCFSGAESCATSERSLPNLNVVGACESIGSAIGKCVWKSPSFGFQHHAPTNSPIPTSRATCDGSGKLFSHGGAGFNSWGHTQTTPPIRYFSRQPPMYEQHGTQEDLFDEGDADMPFDHVVYGNIVSFIQSVSPVVAANQAVESHSITTGGDLRGVGEEAPSKISSPMVIEPSVALRRIWEALDMPFACTIHLPQPVLLAPMRFPAESVVYSPFLSGFRLRFLESSGSYARLKAMQTGSAGGSAAPSHKQPTQADTFPMCNCSEGLCQKDGQKEFACASSCPMQSGSRACTDSRPESPFQMASTTNPDVDPLKGDGADGYLTWAATERPDQRSLVLEQVNDLVLQDPRYSVLLTGNVTELDHQSWIAVLWRPVFDHNHCAKHSCGSFIVYYAPRPPRHEKFYTSGLPSALECMNANWMSPVFRCDYRALSCDIWAPPRQGVEDNGRTSVQSPATTSVDCGAAFSSAVGPSLTDGCVNSNNGNSGSGGVGSGDPPSPNKATGVSGAYTEASACYEVSTASSETRETKCINLPLCFEEPATGGTLSKSFGAPFVQSLEQPALVRIPVVGIIPNRCRADVWFMRCSKDGTPDPAHPRDVGASSASASRCYRAPLFLITSALQLMSWNAVEECERQLAKDATQQDSDPAGPATEHGERTLEGGDTTLTGCPTAEEAAARHMLHNDSSLRVRLLIDGSRCYRLFRESTQADGTAGAVTPTAAFPMQESGEVSVRPRSASPHLTSSASINYLGKPGVVVGGLPDFYQYAQFDTPLMRFAERYV